MILALIGQDRRATAASATRSSSPARRCARCRSKGGSRSATCRSSSRASTASCRRTTTTIEYLAGREFSPKGAAWDRAVAYWRTLPTDDGAAFDREVTIDCDGLAPQVTWGTSPQQVIAIDARVPDPSRGADGEARAAGRARARLHAARARHAARGHAHRRRLHRLVHQRAPVGPARRRGGAAGAQGEPGVQAMCVPGSTPVKRAAEAEGLDRVFSDAGFEWHESGLRLLRPHRRRPLRRPARGQHDQPQLRGPPGAADPHAPREPGHGRGLGDRGLHRRRAVRGRRR